MRVRIAHREPCLGVAFLAGESLIRPKIHEIGQMCVSLFPDESFGDPSQLSPLLHIQSRQVQQRFSTLIFISVNL